MLQSHGSLHALCFPFLLVCVWCYWDQHDQIYFTCTVGVSDVYPNSISFLLFFSAQTPQRIPRSDLSTLSHAKTRTLHIVSTKGNALWLKPWRDPTNTAGKSPTSKCQKTLLSQGGSIRKNNKHLGVEYWKTMEFCAPVWLHPSHLVGFLLVCDNCR